MKEKDRAYLLWRIENIEQQIDVLEDQLRNIRNIIEELM